MMMTRRSFAMAVSSLSLMELTACGSGVPARSAALDPSNPNGPESLPLGGSLAPLDSPGTTPSEIAHEEGPSQHVEHDHAAGNPTSTHSSPPAAAMQAGSSDGSATVYTCSMHPEVISAQPGKCPKCGMVLIPRKDGK
jgi:hypothetical protein